MSVRSLSWSELVIVEFESDGSAGADRVVGELLGQDGSGEHEERVRPHLPMTGAPAIVPVTFEVSLPKAPGASATTDTVTTQSPPGVSDAPLSPTVEPPSAALSAPTHDEEASAGVARTRPAGSESVNATSVASRSDRNSGCGTQGFRRRRR